MDASSCLLWHASIMHGCVEVVCDSASIMHGCVEVVCDWVTEVRMAGPPLGGCASLFRDMGYVISRHGLAYSSLA